MDSKIRRLYRWKKGRKQGPVRIELHPTDRCNLSCRFCWRKGEHEVRPEKELSKEKLLKIVDEAAEMGVKEWIVSGGGEPMMRKETTLEVMGRIKEHDMWGQLTTNGTLFEEEDVKRVVKMGWDQVQISIDGPDAETNNEIRQGGNAFSKAVRTSKMISKRKERLNSEDPFLGYNTILNRLNHDKLEDMIELADEAGSQLVYFEPIYPGYNSDIRLKMNEEEKKEMKKHVKKAERLAEKLSVNTNVDEYLDEYNVDKDSFEERVLEKSGECDSGFMAAPCYQPWYLMGIKGSGLAGCCSTFEEGVDIHDKSLKEAWYSDKFEELREEMLKKQIPDCCSKCSVVVLKSNEKLREKLRRYDENRTKSEMKSKLAGALEWMENLKG
ncbi:MAG: radical SAM/SPASM domain-containing protein [Candidatus Aenigmatarchaeota archaeon]